MTATLSSWSIVIAVLFVPGYPAQQAGRFEEAKRTGLQHLKNGRYDKAAANFEEVWEQDRSDPSVAEYLALAYLNGTERPSGVSKKVLQLMELSIAAGGKASFVVHHSHEKLTWLQGRGLNNYCSGTLSISPGHLAFVGEAKDKTRDHSFDSMRDEIRSILPAIDDRSGTFIIKTKSRNYQMAPRTWDRTDSELILLLSKKYLNVK
ncbi:MAG: hypothetical protein HYR60_04750 [Acidobacteria bacterium]|nr:hypothetical protein [Acidobacteriota bacterium]MBI3471779.1 hypothetical protein [Candidatus Solibacter usitatus]